MAVSLVFCVVVATSQPRVVGGTGCSGERAGQAGWLAASLPNRGEGTRAFIVHSRAKKGWTRNLGVQSRCKEEERSHATVGNSSAREERKKKKRQENEEDARASLCVTPRSLFNVVESLTVGASLFVFIPFCFFFLPWVEPREPFEWTTPSYQAGAGQRKAWLGLALQRLVVVGLLGAILHEGREGSSSVGSSMCLCVVVRREGLMEAVGAGCLPACLLVQ